ncbi:MAG: T9SS type A sorting domain-containing protein [Ignavibacteriales bacterium]|nr:T9SS type A sorting domain-containing protein [Ignavibacteriales bacterium]
MIKLLRILTLNIFVSLLLLGTVKADWPCRADSSVPVVNAIGSQWNLHVTSDSKNGAYYVWQDRRSGSGDKLYIQHMSPSGNPSWTKDGLPLTSTSGYQYYPQILSDGKGGAFIVWQDNRSGYDYDIYAQHIDLNGVSNWTVNGVAVCNAVGHQYNPQLATDGAGGIIVTWQDRRKGQFDIFAQRVDSLGAVRWTPNGQLICNDSTNQTSPKITSDHRGGAFIAWEDFRSGSGSSDIYCQRILSTGQNVWTANGLPLCTAQYTQWNIQMIPDTIGGAIVVWQDRRNNTFDNIYAQRIDPYGNIKWQLDGIALAPVQGNQYYPQLVSDWLGGGVIIWQDNRSGNDYDIYAQRITREGILPWGVVGIPICNSIGHQYNPQVIYQNSYFISAWQDKRGLDFDIYAQRFSASGQIQWNANGNQVATLPFDQFIPQLSIDSMNGAFIGWADYHLNNGSTDIYSQRIGANGIPAGGCYKTFIQDSLSVKANRYIRNWSRKILGKPNAGNVRDSVFKRGAFPYGLEVGINRADSSKKYGWIRYTKSYFLKRALPQSSNARPFDYIIEKSFTGEKRNLSVLRYNNRLNGELITLKLNIASSDVGLIPERLGDIVFKDTLQDNPLNNLKLRNITARVDSMLTMWQFFKNINYPLVSTTLEKINRAFYGIDDTVSSIPLRMKSVRPLFSVPFLRPSVDPPAQLPEFHSISDEEYIPQSISLSQNYPNPFNPYTTIEFIISQPSFVSLTVYNILGQEVATLLNRASLDEDQYTVDFDASAISSGVYFYRIIAEPLSGSDAQQMVRKMVVLK